MREREDGIWESTSFFFGSTLEEASKEVLNAFIKNSVLQCQSRKSSKNPKLVSRLEDIRMLDNLDKIEIQLDLLGA